MSEGHDHGLANIRHERPLRWALALTGGFLIAEVIGAFWTNGLALLSDAAHMSTDTLALIIALLAVRLSRRPPDAKRTFGYVRLESFGALINGLMLFAVAGYILWEAVQRVRHPPQVASLPMLLIAAIGLLVNLVAMRLLRAGSGENLNVKGAYLEVWSDMLGSLGVIVGAVIIKMTDWRIVDPLLAVLIGLWVLPRTWVLLREAGNVLMMGVPKGVNLTDVRNALLALPGVVDVHDLHVWALGSHEPSLTAHLVSRTDATDTSVRASASTMLRQQFHIEHTTLQVEQQHCGQPACEAGRTDSYPEHSAHE